VTTGAPVEIDAALCKACGICVGLCPADVLTGGRDGVPGVAHPERCTACRICEIHCPDFAIVVHLQAGRTRPRTEGDLG
jgi:NAD-dependent dihydropyrimidine dehydrogenase PreA subunit